ncbi:MAG: Smr/MutS family protein [Deltaproteobacteria bacterium]|nr:Smr/MutS family protein [Deltaproteobacteria bacterium]
MPGESILQKLEWNLLTNRLAGYCQSPEGAKRAAAKQPCMNEEDIRERWKLALPLTDLYRQGYRAPVGELVAVEPLIRAVRLGRVLDGKSLRDISALLASVQKVFTFSRDFSPRCATLEGFRNRLVLLAPLQKSIIKAIDEDGMVMDQASPELIRIRNQRRSLMKQIEQKLKHMIHDPAWQLYLQDDFFTKRGERYVIPVKLDGRGRVPGTIVDTSDSGQTLFIEPAFIGELNQSLQDLELSEKLEVIRILRELSQAVSTHGDDLLSDYEALVFLDELSAEGQLACELDAVPVGLSSEPVLHLIQARHPLLQVVNAEAPVANDILLGEGQHILIISGPNAGGKTIVLKTMGMLVLMAKAGLQVPADSASMLYLFDRIFVEMGDAQSLTASLSTFSGHLQGLLPIVNSAQKKDLILLDELAVGTEPQTGAAIAQAVVEHLEKRECCALVTTHYDNLKGLAIHQKGFRNASMEYSLQTFSPTYRLILDVPGQSYGLELAAKSGLPEALISRAEDLRGSSVSAMDDAVSQLMAARDQARVAATEMQEAKRAAEAAEVRWQQDAKLLGQNRKKAVEAIRLRFEKELSAFREHVEEWQQQMKGLRKKISASAAFPPDISEAMRQLSQSGQSVLKKGEGIIRKTGAETAEPPSQRSLPGREATFSTLKAGSQVWLNPLGCSGHILKMGTSPQDKIWVTTGQMKLWAELKDLRILETAAPQPSGKHKADSVRERKSGTSGAADVVFLATSANTLDVRGSTLSEALEKMWQFLDAAVMRGEAALMVIHGHGAGALKSGLRQALQEDSPYRVRFTPGDRSQGGDGVTLVFFES